MKDQLLADYADQLRPLMALAKRAYGSRANTSPAHQASQEYTSLLVEYHSKGGSLLAMAKELEVAYAGLRRRVVTAGVPVVPNRAHSAATPDELADAVKRVQQARRTGTGSYHQQLLTEYESGISLGKLAAGLGLSSSNPLYYGVQKARLSR